VSSERAVTATATVTARAWQIGVLCIMGGSMGIRASSTRAVPDAVKVRAALTKLVLPSETAHQR
jgi:UDP-N-acetylglucosamine:LPS N-acetylglucosamine transferase